MSDYYPAQSFKTLPLFRDSAPPPAPVSRLPTQGKARARDPSTSHVAARKAPVRGHCLAALMALSKGPAGQSEIAQRCGKLPHQIGKRLSELRDKGLAAKTGREVINPNGLGEDEHRITQLGLDELRRATK